MSTTLILSNLFHKKRLEENLDLSSQEILNKSFLNRHYSDAPVDPEPGSWQFHDFGEYVALVKRYKFNSYDHFMYFINEVLNESNRMDHSPKMTIESLDVELVLYTHDINDITESDIKLSKIIDEIYHDIFFIE